MKNWIPITKEEVRDNVDFIIISGDAYIDHPSFGVAIIARVLEKYGYRVAIIAQPDWNNDKDFLKFGKPNLAFLVTAGNIDSMVNHYSVNKNRRKKDIYTPNGEINKRPNRATIVYTNMIKKLFKESPIIIGGIEASLRRFAHYDYWDDKIRKSILIDSKADLLVYGMGEKTIIEIADYLKSGLNVSDITFINGTLYKTKNTNYIINAKVLPSFKEIVRSKKEFNNSFKIQYESSFSLEDVRLIENYGDFSIVSNPPQTPLTEIELDEIFKLPFNYEAHPYYKDIGHISAIDEVKFSISANRGCFASCNFCAITFHQGRVVTSRSVKSVVDEAKKICEFADFKGNINDIGGPTANFIENACKRHEKLNPCKNKKCISDVSCEKLNVSHKKYLEMICEVEKLQKVKKVFIRSGIRYDYVLLDNDKTFLKKLVKDHISGQLRLAPEHIDPKVLKLMGKPSSNVYNYFVSEFYSLSRRYNKKQYVVPYLMSSHPGSDINSAIMLANYLHEINFQPLQVQDFYPTPATLSTCMYYTKYNPLTNQKVYVADTENEKKIQRALLQYKIPKNREIVKKALKDAKRSDLIKKFNI
ncbi:MAG: YgiQ family radical SAM protein [Bacilli bacterium]